MSVLLGSYRRPSRENPLRRLHPSQSFHGIKVLGEVVISKVPVFLKLAECLGDGSRSPRLW